MLVGQLKDTVKRIFLSIAENSDFEIEVMETDKDHVHFLIRYMPHLSPTNSSQAKAGKYTAVVVVAQQNTP
jgi:putative transposase